MSESLLKQLLRQSGSYSSSSTALHLIATTMSARSGGRSVSSGKSDGTRKLSTGSEVFGKGLRLGHSSPKAIGSTSDPIPVRKIGSTLSSLAQTIAGGGITNFLGLGEVVSGFLGLFGGSAPKAETPLVKFSLSGAQNTTLTIKSDTVRKSNTPVRDGQAVISNAVQPALGRVEDKSSETSPDQTSQSALTQPNSMQRTLAEPSLTPTSVNAQWFLDHSHDIARAVKDAMLTSSSINDVISEV